MKPKNPETFEDIGIVNLPTGAGSEVSIRCPQCSDGRQKNRSQRCLSVNTDKKVWCCHHCGWHGSLGYSSSFLKNRQAPNSSMKEIEKSRRKAAFSRREIDRVWRESIPLDHQNSNLAQQYLSNRLKFNDLFREFPHLFQSLKMIKFHQNLEHYNRDKLKTFHPSLVCGILNLAGSLMSLHRIYLSVDGEKANVDDCKKPMASGLPGGIEGSSIPVGNGLHFCDHLGVTEGFEDALFGHLSLGLPILAALNAAGMSNLLVPDTAKEVSILADHDLDGKGVKAAGKLSDRLLSEGRAVQILTPPVPGVDWLDAFLESG